MKYNKERSTAYNGRFCEMAAVTPQTILWEFQRFITRRNGSGSPACCQVAGRCMQYEAL